MDDLPTQIVGAARRGAALSGRSPAREIVAAGGYASLFRRLCAGGDVASRRAAAIYDSLAARLSRLERRRA